MHTMTINILDDQTTEKVRWILDHFRSDGVEIVSEEDLNDNTQIAAIMERIAKRGTAFNEIHDPVAWQREVRQDRPLPGREECV